MKKQTSKVIDKLKNIVKQKGLKYTKQREIILETILESKEHLKTEDIYAIIKQKNKDETLGIATVYRALTFLEEEGLISSISINNTKEYETSLKKHHDHLVCLGCNKIVEFMDDEIELKQEQIANKNGFELLNHSIYLYGLCKDCQK